MKLEIELSHYELSSSASTRAAADAFGLDQDSLARAYRTGRPMELLVTAEQFGQFVALRNAYGGENNIKALKPRMIVNPFVIKVDVTSYRLAA